MSQGTVICKGKGCPICEVFGPPTPVTFGLQYGTSEVKLLAPRLDKEIAERILAKYRLLNFVPGTRTGRLATKENTDIPMQFVERK